MSFVDLRFLVFFPTVVALYLIFPKQLRWALLLVASYLFYMAWKPEYGLLLFAITLIDFLAGLALGCDKDPARRTLYLVTSLTANLGILFVFKYFNFIFSSVEELFRLGGSSVTFPALSLLLPIGISFHIFQSMSYTIDVYRRKAEPVSHLGKFALYVSFFPQLVAGPIERPSGLLKQIMGERTPTLARTRSGVRLMAWGYFKKLVIADNLAPLVTAVYASPRDFPGPSLIIATILFAYQIYCDFSGYTDIARGSARIFGYDLTLNFNRPFKATSIADFWRRWHMSLSSWLRDYLYLPLALSGRRHTRNRTYWSIFVTFVLIGLWHGANWTFVLFGAIHGVYLVVESVTARARAAIGAWARQVLHPRMHTPVVVQRLTVFLLVCFSYIFFRAQSVDGAWYIASHLGSQVGTFVAALGSAAGRLHVIAMDVGWRGLIIGLAGVVVLEVVEHLHTYYALSTRLSNLHFLPRSAVYAALVCAILVLGALGASEQFIYFQF